MRFFTAVLVSLALAIASGVFSGPATLHTVEKYQGATTGRYIVKLKEDVTKSSVVSGLRKSVIHDWKHLNGFAGSYAPSSGP